MTHDIALHVHNVDPPVTPLSNPEKDKWPTPHSARLTALVEGKQHSCRMIAAVLNQEFTTRYTRSAIIGRIHRMGLQIESQPWQPRARDAAKKRRKRARQRIVLAQPVSKTSALYRKHLPRLPEMTKGELRAMLAMAVANTEVLSKRAEA